MPGFTVDDLSAQALISFRKRAARSKRLSDELLAESDTVLIEKLRLFENNYLKRAAVLLFDEDPERLVTGAYVKIGFFRTDSDLLYHDEIHGDLFSQVEKTLDLLLTKYLKAGISYEGPQRVEKFPIPENALREAVINAIAHKDYASANPIQISVYADKLMIWNPGLLPQNWTLKHLTAKHASCPFNPDIANAFFRVAYLESWGRGIDLIRDACKQHSCPDPLFAWDNGLWVTLPFTSKWQIVGPGKSSGKTTQKMSGKMSGKIEGEVVKLMLNNPQVTIPEIAKSLKRTERTIERLIRKLREDNIIDRIGPAKGGHWEVVGDGDE